MCVQTAKLIRAKLKELGYNNKQISVKSKHYSSVDVCIKDLSISIKTIEPICKNFESIDYDERSGEILSGGNTFIFIEYSHEILDQAIEKNLAIGKEIFDTNKNQSFKIVENEKYKVFYFPNNGIIELFEKFENENLSLQKERYYIRNEFDITKAIILLNTRYNLNIKLN